MGIKAINARNQFDGIIRRIRRGDIVSEVEVDIAAGVITSVVTTSSIDELGLKPGSPVVALFKATEVALASFAPA